jgi:signal transduction histidine kinase
MRRQSKAGNQPIKTRRRKIWKRGNRTIVARRRGSFSAGSKKDARPNRELSEALEQLTAASEVLHVISNSSGDLQPVFATMLAKAVQICDADFGNIYRWNGQALQLAASHNTPRAFAEFRAHSPVRNPSTPTGRMITTKTTVHVTDLAAEQLYTERLDPGTVAAVELGGVRTFLSVPMLKEDELVGAFVLARQKEVRPFIGKQIALVTNFAAQAVIAIENGRLLKDLRQRTVELEKSLERLERERNNKLLNLEALAGAISHEVRQPLAAITSSGGAALRFLGREPPNLEEAQSALNRVVSDSHRASQVFDNIRALFVKTDRVRTPVDLNILALEVLQALRQELEDHGVTIQVDLSSELPHVIGHRGQLQEVFINLINNAIEAMDAVEDDRRVLQVKSQRHGGNAIIVTVEDSGTGIDPKNLESIFDAFVTTKATGMGFGLAICRMIIERHDGQLSAARVDPRGSVFRVVLPTAVALS